MLYLYNILGFLQREMGPFISRDFFFFWVVVGPWAGPAQVKW